MHLQYSVFSTSSNMNKQAKILATGKREVKLIGSEWPLQCYDLDNPATWLSAPSGAEEAERPPHRAAARRRHHKVALHLCCWCNYITWLSFVIQSPEADSSRAKKPPTSKFWYIWGLSIEVVGRFVCLFVSAGKSAN